MNSLLINESNKSCVASLMLTLLMMSSKLVKASISPRADKVLLFTFFDELVQNKFFREKKIGKRSEIWEISMPDSKFHGSLINKLSISVA